VLSRIDLDTHFDTDLPDILFDRDKIKQVFLNIINNAIDAMPRGGTLSIATAAKPSSVLISVADTGSGLPLESREKVFAPFFSTKSNGTGLGLTLAKNIVEAHGGSIWFENRERETMFCVEIPVRVM